VALEPTMKRVFPLLAVAIASSACTMASLEPQPMPITSTNEIHGAAVVRRPISEPAPPSVIAEPATAANTSAPRAAIVIPPNTQYVCVSEVNGVAKQTSIEFSPKVADICRRHPEMGPCKYEREVCRRSNGRVYTANGVEITKQTEAEYDKKVMRVVFKAN
jgi:hypothetical protein